MKVASTAAPGEALARMLEEIAAVLDVDASTLNDASSPESVPSWDSLNHLNIALAVESEFVITLTPEQVMQMSSVGAIRAVLRSLGVEV